MRGAQAAVAVLRHAVAGGGDGLPEQDLADVGGDVLVAVDGLGNARGAGGELAVAFGAVAVELDVGQVQRVAFHAGHGVERGAERHGQ